jgi:hypothetical protein
MAPKRIDKFRAKTVSWLALVAATAGLATATIVPTFVRAERGLREGGTYRLIVQSFERGSRSSARPRASAQRTVTAEELRRGIQLQLVDVLGADRSGSQEVVAWVEQGDANLEFDGARARPSRGCLVGTATYEDGTVQIALRRRS